MPTRSRQAIKTIVDQYGQKAEWYALGVLDTGSDYRVTSAVTVAFGQHYAALARDFYEERRTNLPNIRSVWPEYLYNIDIAGRVIAGSAVLDIHEPFWWVWINVDTLNIGDSRHCVIGQLKERKGFDAYVTSLMDPADPNADNIFTFCVTNGFVSDYGADQNADLTAAWKALIIERRQQELANKS